MTYSADKGLAFAGTFFRWWRSELTMLIPERMRRLSQNRGQIVLVLSGAGPITLGIENSTQFVLLGTIADPTSPEAAAKVQTILQQANLARLLAGNKLGLCIRLAARSALCRTIELPLAAETNIYEVIGYELDRYTPFRANQVYYCHRVLKRDATAQRIVAEVTLVLRTTVEEAIAVARRLGFTPDRVDVDNPAKAGHSDNLMGGTASPGRGAVKRLTQGLAATAVVLAVIAAALPFAATQRRAAAMADESAGIRRQIQASDALQKELQALRDDQRFLAERKMRTPTVSSLLLEATRILPDETWLVEFRVNETEVELAGVTASASALIGLLERSGLFTNSSFRSPVTTDPNGRERFSIATHVIEKRRQ